MAPVDDSTETRWLRVRCPACGAHVTIPPNPPYAECTTCGMTCPRSLPAVE